MPRPHAVAPWDKEGARAAVRASQPGLFIKQYLLPLFFKKTDILLSKVTSAHSGTASGRALPWAAAMLAANGVAAAQISPSPQKRSVTAKSIL